MYQYNEQDQKIVDQRVAQYRDQTQRFLAGELNDEEFRQLQEFSQVCSKKLFLTVPNCDLERVRSRLAYFHYTSPTHCDFFTPALLHVTILWAGFRVVYEALINQINPAPLISSLLFSSERFCCRYLQLFSSRQYNMTCQLVVKNI